MSLTGAVDTDVLARARTLIATSLVWDNHSCMPLRADDTTFLPQLERCRAAGFDVVSLNIGFGPQSLEAHLRMLASMRRWIAAHADRYALARTTADIERARAAGHLAVIFDVEGMAPLDAGDDGIVALFRELGVGWMLVAYNRNNAAGGGCYDDDPGLSAHGHRILAEMRRVGMLACCSHSGPRTALDVFAAAGNPVIFSHSNPRAVHAHTRNISDELIRGCAATGGVIGINGIGPFLGANDDRPETFVRHIDYVAALVGVEHVGIGLDFVFDQAELLDYLASMRETFPHDSAFREPPNMVAPEALLEITAGLCGLGYGDDDVRKILGGNWLRVARQVWGA
jgi:membrane dipeptidase